MTSGRDLVVTTTYTQHLGGIPESRHQHGQAPVGRLDVAHNAGQSACQEEDELRGGCGIVSLDKANDGGASLGEAWRQLVAFSDQRQRHDAIEAPEGPNCEGKGK